MFVRGFFMVLFLSVISLCWLVDAQQTLTTAINKNPINASNNKQIVYPSQELNNNRKPSHNRVPVSDSRFCKKYELLYPGDNEGDWVCDCKPGFVHYPETGLCYEAYTQGPCLRDEIIRLRNDSSVPQCLKNQCPFRQVFHNGNCFYLNDQEGCIEYTKFIGRDVFLVVNPTTLELTCADEDFKYECVDRCCNGSKREFRNICPK